MENECSEAAEEMEAAENMIPTSIAVVDEDHSLEVNHSDAGRTAETKELSDAISSGSSFEILSVKEDVGEIRENSDESDGISSILRSCSTDDVDSEQSYRAERTKKFVMESEFEFVEDNESNGSGHFVKVSKVELDETNENSDKAPDTPELSAERQLPVANQELGQQNDMAEPLPESERTITGDIPLTEMEAIMTFAAEVPASEQSGDAVSMDAIDAKCGIQESGQDSSDQGSGLTTDLENDQNRCNSFANENDDNSNLIEDANENRNGAVVKRVSLLTRLSEFLERFMLKCRESSGSPRRRRRTVTFGSRREAFGFIGFFFCFLFLTLVTFALINQVKKRSCTYADIGEHFDSIRTLPNPVDLPSCLEYPITAKELYKLASTVHISQISYLNFRNASLSHEVSQLMRANQALEESLADTRTRLSTQLVKNRELEDHVTELMLKLEPNSLEHVKRKVFKPTKELMMYDEWDQLNTLTPQDHEVHSEVGNAFVRLMKVIKDFRNTSLVQEDDDLDRKATIRKHPLVFQTFLRSFMMTYANVSDGNLTDQLAVIENSFTVIGECVNRLQTLMPDRTVYDIFRLDWHQVQEITKLPEASDKKDATADQADELTLEPCHVFISESAKNSSDPFTSGKKKWQNYVNRTLNAVDKIGQTMRNTLEAIKALPDKFFGNGELFKSFGSKFKNTVESMNKRFSKGYNKLKEKVNRKFKSSLHQLSKSVRAGWDKINKRSVPVDTVLSGNKNRFWKQNAKRTGRSDDQHDPDGSMEDSEKAEESMKVDVGPFEEATLDEGDVELDEANFLDPNDLVGGSNKDETESLMHKLDSLFDEPGSLNEYRLIKEMSAIRSEDMTSLVKVSFDILKLTESGFNSLDLSERTDFWKRLSSISVARSEVSDWVGNWVNCQQRWWQEVASGNSNWLKELVSTCSPWLMNWQAGVREKFSDEELGANSQDRGPSSSSSSDEADMSGHCKREDCLDYKQIDKELNKLAEAYITPGLMTDEELIDQNDEIKFPEFGPMHFDSDDDRDAEWYFRESGRRDLSDSDWYFQMMEDRENGRRDSKRYFRNKPGDSKHRQKPSRKGHRGR